MSFTYPSNASHLNRYSAALFHLESDLLAKLSEINEKRALLDLVGIWIFIFALLQTSRVLFATSYRWYVFVPLIFLIAGRIGALVNTLHEASHGFLSKNRKRNDAFATWLAALPLGIHYEGYAAHHAIHHTYAATPKDVPTDLEKYREVNFTRPQVYLHLVKDLLGITAVVTALKYFWNRPKNAEASLPLSKHRLITLLQIGLVQSLLIGVCFAGDWKLYLLFWIVPCISPHMFLMRFRGIAEHGLSSQLDRSIVTPGESRFYTRSFLTSMGHYDFRPWIWIEKILIGSLNIQYHHEHHLYPQIPHYHLEALHRTICHDVNQLNPLVYETGYFKAALRNLFWTPQELNHPAGA